MKTSHVYMDTIALFGETADSRVKLWANFMVLTNLESPSNLFIMEV